MLLRACTASYNPALRSTCSACPVSGFEELAEKEAAKEEDRRSSKRRRGGSDEEDEDDEDVDPEMAALMGFGGFGTSKM